MRDYLIIFLTISIASLGCLGRTARSGGSISQGDLASLGNGADTNGDGIPDDVENEIREQYGLGQNEPINKDTLQDYLDSKKADAQLALATTWKPSDITAMAGISAQVLSSAMNSIFNYMGQSAKAQAEVDKAEKMRQAYLSGKVGYSVAPIGQGKLVAKDINKIGKAKYVASDNESFIEFDQIKNPDVGSGFIWKTKTSATLTSGVYSVVLKPQGGGYIQFAYFPNDSMFNGLYTTNVKRCCKYDKGLNKWDEPTDGLITYGINNYIITEVRLIGQTSSTNINETYTLEGADSKCGVVNCTSSKLF